MTLIMGIVLIGVVTLLMLLIFRKGAGQTTGMINSVTSCGGAVPGFTGKCLCEVRSSNSEAVCADFDEGGAKINKNPSCPPDTVKCTTKDDYTKAIKDAKKKMNFGTCCLKKG